MQEENCGKDVELKLIGEKMYFIKPIGEGSFGKVYLCEHKKLNSLVAVKIEELKKGKKSSRVNLERKMYLLMQKHGITCIPRLIGFVESDDKHILTMTALGKNLEEIHNKLQGKFDTPTIFQLGIDMITIIANVHSCGIIHRDIKPNNFMIGRKNERDKLFIVDFGLSKLYIKNGNHIRQKSGRSLVGTARYVSINVHIGHEPSRRDDLESLGYLLVYFYKGKLPWQGISKGKNQLETIKEIKMSTPTTKLCQEMPNFVKLWIDYSRSLDFESEPDYQFIYDNIINEANKMAIIPKYCWS